jgi:hypothetical protein
MPNEDADINYTLKTKYIEAAISEDVRKIVNDLKKEFPRKLNTLRKELSEQS